EPLTHQAREDVVPAAGSIPDNPAYRSRRIALRPYDARNSRHRSGARGQMQELSTGKFHLNLPPSHHSITSLARASTVVGTSRPSAFAALRLMTNSYLVGACTGRSPGFSPLRMRST